MRNSLILAAFAVAAAPALAQTAAPADPAAAAARAGATAQPAAPAGDVAAQLTAGATVYDTQGQPVGTIEAVDGGNVIVSTGTAKASIPASSFGSGATGPVLAMTRAQLEAAVAGAAAAGPGGR